MKMVRGHIKITKKEETRVNGKPIFTDTIFRECMAEIQDLYGNELYQALQTEMQNTIVFKVRYCKEMDLLRTHKQDYRVIYQGVEYNIYQVDYGKYAKKYVLIKCQNKI